MFLDDDVSDNGATCFLKGKQLDVLPDDKDDLANALQALAGPALGQVEERKG
jgi:hypothetical protein